MADGLVPLEAVGFGRWHHIAGAGVDSVSGICLACEVFGEE